MWALGCVVHELLTGQIPFCEVDDDDDGEDEMTGLDLGPMEVLGPQTDMDAVRSFCDGKTEFPTNVLKESGVSDDAIGFMKAILVANPESRAEAKGALDSPWFIGEEDSGMDIFYEEPGVTTMQHPAATSTQVDQLTGMKQQAGLYSPSASVTTTSRASSPPNR